MQENFKFKTGQKISGWKIENQLSRNASSEIYVASKQKIKAALKLYASKKDYPSAFKEFEIYESVSKKIKNSPKPIGLSDENDNQVWLATEFIEAKNLKEIIETNGPLNELDWFKFAQKFFTILDQIHRMNIVHRDIKPSNILYKNAEPILIDYELSYAGKILDIDESFEQFPGTPDFSSPEHRSGDYLPEMDVFSAASTLVFLGTGKKAFPGKNEREIIRKISSHDPEYYELSDKQRELLKPLFEKNKSDRKSVSEALDYLSKGRKNTTKWKSRTEYATEIVDDKNIWDIIRDTPDPNAKLFTKHRQSRNLNLKRKFINVAIFLLASFTFLAPQILFITKVTPQSLDERVKVKMEDNILWCLGMAFSLNRNSTEKDIRNAQNYCDNIVAKDYPEKFLALAQISRMQNNKLDEENSLIKAAMIDNPKSKVIDTFDSLVNFYYINDNFATFGNQRMTECRKLDSGFCSKILGFYYLAIDDEANSLKYLTLAAEQKDIDAAANLDKYYLNSNQPVKYKPFILESAQKGNFRSMQYLFGIYGESEWYEKLLNKDDPLTMSLQILSEINKGNFDSATDIVFECLKKNRLNFRCKDSLSILMNFRADKDKFKENLNQQMVQAALLGSNSARLDFAQLQFQNGEYQNAREWYFLVAEKDISESVEAYIGIADIDLTIPNTYSACLNVNKARDLLIKLDEKKNSISLMTDIELNTDLSLPLNEIEANNQESFAEKLSQIESKLNIYCQPNAGV